MTLISNRVTEGKRTGGTLWLVSAEWLGGHDRRRFLLENIFDDESKAKDNWERLTVENHNKSYGRSKDYDCGFVRHPIRVFQEVQNNALHD